MAQVGIPCTECTARSKEMMGILSLWTLVMCHRSVERSLYFLGQCGHWCSEQGGCDGTSRVGGGVGVWAWMAEVRGRSSMLLSSLPDKVQTDGRDWSRVQCGARSACVHGSVCSSAGGVSC